MPSTFSESEPPVNSYFNNLEESKPKTPEYLCVKEYTNVATNDLKKSCVETVINQNLWDFGQNYPKNYIIKWIHF